MNRYRLSICKVSFKGRAKWLLTATANRYMALGRTILRKACNEWEWLDRVPKVSMFWDAEGRIRSPVKAGLFKRWLVQLGHNTSFLRRRSILTSQISTGEP